MLQRGYQAVYWFSYEHAPSLHPIDGYALSVGMVPLDRRLRWSVDPAMRHAAALLLQEVASPLIGFSPVSEHALRTLPLPLVQSIVDQVRERFGGTVVVTGKSPLPVAGCLDLSGQLAGMEELAAVMSHCDAWMTVDSGPFHLAQALDLPVVGFFGCTLPELRVTRPGRVQVVRNESLTCLGCYHAIPSGAEILAACAREDLACMHGIEPETVMEALRAVMAGEPDERLHARMAEYDRLRSERMAFWNQAAREQAHQGLRARILQIAQGHTPMKRLERTLRRWRKGFVRKLRGLVAGRQIPKEASE
jgi:hypothetical protein